MLPSSTITFVLKNAPGNKEEARVEKSVEKKIPGAVCKERPYLPNYTSIDGEGSHGGGGTEAFPKNSSPHPAYKILVRGQDERTRGRYLATAEARNLATSALLGPGHSPPTCPTVLPPLYTWIFSYASSYLG